MSAEPAERPNNQRVDLITEFTEEYAKVFRDAEVSHQHTATEGWHRLFGAARTEEQAITRQLCRDLEAAAQQLQLIGSSEDSEKEVNEIKKRMTSLRERREAFDRSTIAPVKEPVEACQRVIEQFRAKARRQEQDAPLHNVGLEHLMSDAISVSNKVSWNDESGTVEIELFPK